LNSHFHAFSVQHLAVVGAIAILCLVATLTARRISFPSRKWMGRSLGILLLGYVAVLYLMQASRNALAWEYSLPLGLCNLVLFACIISLFRPNQWTTEIAYFWGLGGTLQATLTPDLSQGFPSWDFILFFWSHGGILAAIFFLVAGCKFRPGKRTILRMMIALNCYALVVGAINAMGGWNYGYLCRKPDRPSLLDFLGPWPWYLLALELVALVMFLLLSLPWRLSPSVNDRQPDS
jgi:hypothetical integral membrane protein (TIGR02206 family)